MSDKLRITAKKILTQEQIIALLREAESGQCTIAELCRLKSVSQNNFHKWRT